MNNLLKAVGFWIWGLVAIGLSVSMVSVSYRMLSVYRSHGLAAGSRSSSEIGSEVEVASPPALHSETTEQAPAALNEASVDASRRLAIATMEAIAARNAAQANQDALNSLEAAQRKAPPTTYESKSIQEFKGYPSISLDKFKATQSAYEAGLSRGAYKEEQLAGVFRALFQLAATLQQPAKAVAYGEKANDLGALKSNDLLIMSEVYYQEKDCKDSGVWGDKAIAAFKTAGEAPKEVLYQLKLQCASNANDTGAMKAALYELVRLTNKTAYWNNVIRLERQDERDDHNTLMIYRVMFDTHSMNADTDYIEMAQLLGDAGLSGEARVVLEKAMSSGVVKDEHKERTTRLLDALNTRADADLNKLPALDAEARKNPAGVLDVKLGEVYFGAGDYGDAASAISRAIGKGQLLQPDEAYVSLGRSLAAEKDPAGAKQALAKLKSLPIISPRVLKLWNLYADMIPETVAEPL
jgi:tetratricopeptide (TPR) repeat protein